MTLIPFVNQALSLAVIVSQIFIVLTIIGFFFFRKEFDDVFKFLGKRGILFAFLISLGSLIASLFYSNIAGFPPCELCWFQRVFMYPQVILLGMALVKKDNRIIDYALSLGVAGFLISLYHNYMYYYNGGLNVFCQLGGMQVSCIKRYVLEFGYVTIPLMALTGFALLVMFLFLQKAYLKNNA